MAQTLALPLQTAVERLIREIDDADSGPFDVKTRFPVPVKGWNVTFGLTKSDDKYEVSYQIGGGKWESMTKKKDSITTEVARLANNKTFQSAEAAETPRKRTPVVPPATATGLGADLANAPGLATLVSTVEAVAASAAKPSEDGDDELKVGSIVNVKPPLNKPSAGKFNRAASALRKTVEDESAHKTAVDFDFGYDGTRVFLTQQSAKGPFMIEMSIDGADAKSVCKKTVAEKEEAIAAIEHEIQASQNYEKAKVTEVSKSEFTTKEYGTYAMSDKDVLWTLAASKAVAAEAAAMETGGVGEYVVCNGARELKNEGGKLWELDRSKMEWGEPILDKRYAPNNCGAKFPSLEEAKAAAEEDENANGVSFVPKSSSLQPPPPTPPESVKGDKSGKRKAVESERPSELPWFSKEEAKAVLAAEDKVGELYRMKMRTAYPKGIVMDADDEDAQNHLDEQKRTFREEAQSEAGHTKTRLELAYEGLEKANVEFAAVKAAQPAKKAKTEPGSDAALATQLDKEPDLTDIPL